MKIESTTRMGAARIGVVGLLLTLLAGCAGMGQRGTPPEQVTARAQQRQDALAQGDLDRVYQFFTPGFRGSVTPQTYRASVGKALQYISGKVESVECESLEKCIAKVKVETKPLAVPRFTGTITTYADETWLLEAGQWWFFQKL